MPTPAIFKRQEPPRTAFVLGAGGNLGAIQVGMLRALAERGIVPDVVLGCSVGALNGAVFAQDPTLDGALRLEELWRSVTAEALMPSSRVPNLLQLTRRGAALHDNVGLQATLYRLLDVDDFDELAVHYECVAVDIDEAREVWFSSGAIIEAVLASAALPAVYPIVEIGENRYADGGVVNPVPITRAVDLGCTEIWVMHCGAHGRPRHEVRRPIDAALLAYWAGRNARFARDLAHLPDEVSAFVLPPGDRPGLRYDDFSRSGELVQRGYELALEYLDALEELDAAKASPLVFDPLVGERRGGYAIRSALSRASERVREARRAAARAAQTRESKDDAV